MILIQTAGFSVALRLADTSHAGPNWAWVAWAAGFGGVVLSLFYGQKTFNGVPLLAGAWISARALLATLIFATVLALIVVLASTQLLIVHPGSLVTVLLLTVFASWSLSNWFAFWVSEDLVVLGQLMPSHSTIEHVDQYIDVVRLPAINKRTLFDELNDVVKKYNWLVSQANSLAEVVLERNQNAILGNLAAQVAHDIRSPLAALTMAVDRACAVPEESRILIRSASHRIQDIANVLLESRAAKPETTEPEPVFLAGVIDTVVSEKRTQNRHNVDVLIHFDNPGSSFGIFVNTSRRELARVISNLLENAIQAVAGRGTVSVSLTYSATIANLIVADDGCGISSENVTKISRGPFSTKENGHGLGLRHAHQFASENNGRLAFASVLGQGTQVQLSLEKVDSPAWFLPSLHLFDNDHVLILDDDISIHHIWNRKLEASQRCDLQVHHASTEGAFHRYVTRLPPTTLCLVDFELLGSNANGLELIAREDVASRCALVTSHFEDARIKLQCESLNIKILPKPMVPFVPIHWLNVGQMSSVDTSSMTNRSPVLIDDDMLVSQIWQDAASSSGLSLKHFSSLETFFAEITSFSRDSDLYLDSCIGGARRGEVISHFLRQLGFVNLHVTTGYLPEQISVPEGVTVRDKHAPF